MSTIWKWKDLTSKQAVAALADFAMDDTRKDKSSCVRTSALTVFSSAIHSRLRVRFRIGAQFAESSGSHSSGLDYQDGFATWLFTSDRAKSIAYGQYSSWFRRIRS
jgi:hypothetical protein